MEKKKFAKIYLLSLIGLYVLGAVFLFILIFAVNSRPEVSQPFSTKQIIEISLLCPLIPTASYAGVCSLFGKIKGLSKGVIIAFCVLFPVTLLITFVYGAVMIIPSIIKQIRILIKTEN